MDAVLIGDGVHQQGDLAVQTVPARLTPVPDVQSGECGIQCLRRGRQLELYRFFSVIAGVVEVPLGHLQQDGVVRHFGRQIQCFVCLHQWVVPLHITARVFCGTFHDHAALPLAVFPPDPLKVQQVKEVFRKILRAWYEPAFRAEHAQLGIVQGVVHHMAAVGAVGQIDQPGKLQRRCLSFAFHFQQALKGDLLLVTQL